MAYLPFQKAVGVTFSFLPFIGVLVASIFFMGLFLPETKGKSIDEIVREFRRRRTEVSRHLTIGGGAGIGSAPELEPLIAGHLKKGFYGREARKLSRLSTFSELSEISSALH